MPASFSRLDVLPTLATRLSVLSTFDLAILFAIGPLYNKHLYYLIIKFDILKYLIYFLSLIAGKARNTIAIS